MNSTEQDAENSTSLKSWLVVIPARIGSQRLSRKPLADLGGKPLVVRVYEKTKALRQLGAQVVVATDSEEIVRVLEEAKIPSLLTSPAHQSGTDRCYEAALSSDAPFIMNLQGDEPFIGAEDLLSLAQTFPNQHLAEIGTLAYRSMQKEDMVNPNVVKIALAQNHLALYFSRAPIPFDREAVDGVTVPFWHHLGVYAYTRERLAAFCAKSPSPLETKERLEQLRALEAGWTIYVHEAQERSVGIDTPEDLEAARAKIR